MLPPSEADAYLSRDPILAALLSAGGPLGGAYQGRSHFETLSESLRVSRSPKLQPRRSGLASEPWFRGSHPRPLQR